MENKPRRAPAQKKPVASMARGTSKKPTDNLALDAMDALAAGMTYGRWKAEHPNTKEANEPRLAPKKKDPEQYEPRKVHESVCCVCGKKFLTLNKKRVYCDDVCRQQKTAARDAARKAKKEREVLNDVQK